MGNAAVFKEIYLQLKIPLEKFLYMLVKSSDEASDISQEVFIALWEYREKLDSSKDLRSYLFKIARNKVLNRFAHAQVEERYVAELVLDGEPEGQHTDEQLLAQDTQLLVELAVRRMPDMRRQIFEMHHNDLMDNEAIATNLQISKESVANHLARARNDIMKHLKAPDAFPLLFILLLIDIKVNVICIHYMWIVIST
jgi:RNA polymerase sigma-70 factor (ECF subfamily)